MLQTRIQLSDRDEIDFFRYAVKCGLDLDNWWQQLIANIFFTKRWNDVKKREMVIVYYIDHINRIPVFRKFAKLLLLWNIFQYARSSWKDFKKDREDLVLDSTNYAKTDKRHAVNMGIDWLRFKEYGSYWSSKYNFLWIPFRNFFWLLRHKDIKESVYFFKKV
jgi:hypothetical protein